MAVQDWLNANVFGNTTVGDLGSSAIDFYDLYQQREGGRDSIDEITQGYDKGIDYLQDTGEESKQVLGGLYDTTMGQVEGQYGTLEDSRSLYGDLYNTNMDAVNANQEYLGGSLDEYGNIYNTNMENLDPYLGAGSNALDQYMGLMGDPSTIADDPGYQWRLGQGEQAVQRSLAAAGYADPMGSGANPTWLTEYAQGYATDELDRALNRRLPIIQTGESATKSGIQAGSDYGQGIGNIAQLMNQNVGMGIDAGNAYGQLNQGVDQSLGNNIRTGMMAGDSYGSNLSRINQYMGTGVANMYKGRADAIATKDLIDSQAMSGFLKGAQGLLNSASGNPNMMALVTGAIQGQQTTSGDSVWSMIADAFGFDEGDESIISQITESIMGGGTNADGSPGGINWGELGTDLFGALDLGDIGNIDWANILTPITGSNFEEAFANGFSLADISIGNIDWDNLFDWGTSITDEMFSSNWADDFFSSDIPELDGGGVDWDNILAITDQNGLSALDLGGFDFSSLDNSLWDSLSDTVGNWGSSIMDFFR